MRIFELLNTGLSREITEPNMSLSITDGSGLGVDDTISLTIPGFIGKVSELADRIYVLQPVAGGQEDIFHGPYDLQDMPVTGPEGMVTLKGRKNLHWEAEIASQETEEEKRLIAEIKSKFLAGADLTTREPYKTWLSYLSEGIQDDPNTPEVESISTFLAETLNADLAKATDFGGIVSTAERWGLTIHSDIDIDTGSIALIFTSPLEVIRTRYPLEPKAIVVQGRQEPADEFAGVVQTLHRTTRAITRRQLRQIPGITLDTYDESPSYSFPSVVNRPGRYRTRKIVAGQRTLGVGEDVIVIDEGADAPELFIEDTTQYLTRIFVEMKRWELQNTSMTAKITVPKREGEGNDVIDLTQHVIPRMIVKSPNPCYPDLDDWRVVGVTRQWDQDAYSEFYDLALHQGYFYRIGG